MKKRCSTTTKVKQGRNMPMVMSTAPLMPPAMKPSHVMNITSGVGTTFTMAIPSRRSMEYSLINLNPMRCVFVVYALPAPHRRSRERRFDALT